MSGQGLHAITGQVHAVVAALPDLARGCIDLTAEVVDTAVDDAVWVRYPDNFSVSSAGNAQALDRSRQSTTWCSVKCPAALFAIAMHHSAGGIADKYHAAVSQG